MTSADRNPCRGAREKTAAIHQQNDRRLVRRQFANNTQARAFSHQNLMHPRNPYLIPPDFSALADVYSPLKHL